MSQTVSQTDKPIAVYYEHPDWYRPLFAELERRGIPTLPIDARAHIYDVAEESVPFGMLFNRMSPSAYLRATGGHGIFYTLGYLAHLERLGVRTVNGMGAYTMELSKARQMTLLQSLGLGYPVKRASSAIRRRLPPPPKGCVGPSSSRRMSAAAARVSCATIRLPN